MGGAASSAKLLQYGTAAVSTQYGTAVVSAAVSLHCKQKLWKPNRSWKQSEQLQQSKLIHAAASSSL